MRFRKFLMTLSSIIALVQIVQADSWPEMKEKEVKSALWKIGEGAETKVEVKLRDGSKVRGYIGNLGSQTFTLVDPAVSLTRELKYREVRWVSEKKLSSSTAILIGFVAGFASVVALILTSF